MLPDGFVITSSHLNKAEECNFLMRDHHLVTKPQITHLFFKHYVCLPTCNRIYMRSECAAARLYLGNDSDAEENCKGSPYYRKLHLSS